MGESAVIATGRATGLTGIDIAPEEMALVAQFGAAATRISRRSLCTALDSTETIAASLKDMAAQTAQARRLADDIALLANQVAAGSPRAVLDDRFRKFAADVAAVVATIQQMVAATQFDATRAAAALHDASLDLDTALMLTDQASIVLRRLAEKFLVAPDGITAPQQTDYRKNGDALQHL
jgi:hypothetical protein